MGRPSNLNGFVFFFWFIFFGVDGMEKSASDAWVGCVFGFLGLYDTVVWWSRNNVPVLFF